MIPIIINNRDLLTWPKAMLEKIQTLPDAEVVIVDNASTYEPLLEWYSTEPCRIVRLQDNVGHHAPWARGTVDGMLEESGQDFYVVTDPDLDISGVPDDLLDVCKETMEIYGDVLNKVGLSLEADDLPTSRFGKDVAGWEAQFWKHPCNDEWEGRKLPHSLFMAAVDTTWAMYRRGSVIAPQPTGQVRLDRPYTARHLPWYITDETVTDEYSYYTENASPCSTWGRILRDSLKGEHK